MSNRSNRLNIPEARDAMERMNMSARAYDRILKVARTIADLEGTADVLDRHSWAHISLTASSTAPPIWATICNTPKSLNLAKFSDLTH